MSDRIDLSTDTWIENGCLYTTNIAVAVSWPMGKTDCGCEYSSGWEWQDDLDGEEWGSSEAWRISLTACWEIYRYHEGEPGLRIWLYMDCVALMYPDTRPFAVSGIMVALHRRAAIVCDTAEQFRALYAALKEARGG